MEMTKHSRAVGFTVVLGLLTMLLTMFLTGCTSDNKSKLSDSGTEQGNKVQEPIKLNVGYISGTMSRELFLEIAIEKEIFKKYGLEIQAKGYAVGGQMIQDMAGGNVDIALAGPSPAMAGAAQGVDLKIVASFIKNNSPLIARQGINSLQDLNGKKVGTPGRSSIQETMLNYLERQAGFKSQHVYGKPAALVGYFEKGEIDAILAWEPVAAQTVEKLKAHYLLDTAIPNAEACEVVVTGKLFRENPEAVVRYLKAMEETRQVLLGNTEERIKVAAVKTGLPESVVTASVQRSKLFLESPELNMDSIRIIAKEDAASEKLKGVTQEGLEAFLEKVIDTTLLQQALSEKGQ